MKYSFRSFDNCVMCGHTTADASVLGKRLNKSQGRNPKTKLGITTTVVKCANCGLIFCNPLPIPNKIEDHYGVPAEEYWKKSQLEVAKHFFTYQIEIARELLNMPTGGKALDVGAGQGKTMVALNRAGFDAYGIEPGQAFYDYMIEHAKLDPSRLQVKSCEDAEFDENSFDFISFGVVLEHIYDPGEALKKALRWLKPGGIIFVEVPSADWLINKIANLYYRLTGTDYVGNLSPMHNPYHLYEFTRKSFEAFCQANNAKLVKTDNYVGITYMPALIDPILKKYMESTNTGIGLYAWIQKPK